ncbi:MAG TPA: hypothetical protein ACFYD2_10085 [Candidatus Avalokitesvara rifleensis]|uniref:hypothetical protein n=1 Tax=Candidatus Avalokitesvara rifleensis TaxID=3367620 RepID=UPI0027130D4C|nr:hypothetical protein [Candidatus Brocadiales bacterium]
MEYEEDNETFILQKLDDMIDFVESFTSSLSKPAEGKGVTKVPVHSPVRGELFWLKEDRQLVRRGWRIALVQFGTSIEESKPVASPADGQLSIIVYGGRVGEGTEIAEIETDVLA